MIPEAYYVITDTLQEIKECEEGSSSVLQAQVMMLKAARALNVICSVDLVIKMLLSCLMGNDL